MSTFTTPTSGTGPASSTGANSSGAASAALPLGYSQSHGEPQWLGLPVSAWFKIGVISLLMLALYWANFARLWLKTNPFTGQGNWEHAIVIPLIGIYYLYVWRDQLLGHVRPEADANRWSLPGIWALLMGVPLMLALAAHPILLAGGGGGVSPAEVLGGFADGGVAKLIPVVAGLVVLSSAAAGLVYLKRQELKYPAMQAWLDNVWHGLGAWLTAMGLLWGVFFFVVVLVPASLGSVTKVVSFVIATIGLAGLAHIAYWGKSKLWRERYDAILSRSSGWFGGFVMIWGILFSFWGIWPGQNDFFKDIGMVVALFGVVTLLAGWRVMKVAWFPVVFLFCAIPWPDQVYSWVAMPLQNFAAKIGVFALTLTGVDADKFGTKILFAGKDGKPEMLNVAEACAGLKSLMTFISVGAAVAFLSTRMLWQKLLIVASAVPIAILCNAGRVAGQGLLHRYVSPEWSQNFAHAFAGLVMLIPGFFMILAICWVMDHLFIEEIEDDAVLRRARKSAASAAASGASVFSKDAIGVIEEIRDPAAPVAAKVEVAEAAHAAGLATAAPTEAAKPRPAAAPKVITIPKRPAQGVNQSAATGAKPAAAPAARPAASVPTTANAPADATKSVPAAARPGVAPGGPAGAARPQASVVPPAAGQVSPKPTNRAATTSSAARPAPAKPAPAKPVVPAKPAAAPTNAAASEPSASARPEDRL
ncbi:exosortase/archaeosortase family protein [Humisphaera borealis]|uniref:Exosortase/archaeosortase family protein n=1 Tax=Humisphaera borealis TaxID=2807512 RepID=A0A7M2WQD0_9BACT|nr:exosortase/archaeosortase family protein [Humisphaera borealis]QOV87656.1 exosortase/archaeosortase family protein [Humisphaera borealis]